MPIFSSKKEALKLLFAIRHLPDDLSGRLFYSHSFPCLTNNSPALRGSAISLL